MTCHHAVDVGAYVLGALDPAERTRLEVHLPTCSPCRAELAELAGLPGLLSHLSAREAEQVADAPPAHLLESLLSRAGQRRNRRIRAAGVAAALLILAGAGVGAAVSTAGSSPGRQVTSTAGPITALATLRTASTGVTVDLDLRGVPAGTQCRLVVSSTDGKRIGAGTWYADYDGDAHVRETAALPLDQVASLRVEDLSGALLVAVPVSSG